MDSQWGQEVFLISLMSVPALGLTQSPIQYIWGDPFPLRVKQSMCEGDHSTHSSAEVNNVAVPSTPSFCPLGMHGAP
jgi:hypothetical protein